ncbi:TlpA disulfide reductase family protein [Actinophytocola xinjiangensis]|uniref:TlpA disulfide reductase family protein n=1 Tax=Actinophytocola xinjiangensis TaxID=485602 RepID=UPI00138FAC0D|nr:TlpA disulfide reductase family protein [Actinophytocola xinjiangensis]
MRIRGLLVGVLLVVTSCSSSEAAAVLRDGSIVPVGQRVAIGEVSGEDLLDPARTVAVDDYVGQVVVVNVWGAWCPSCQAEAGDLERVHQEFVDEDVAFVGINVRDRIRESAVDFVRDRSISYPSIHDPSMRTFVELKDYRNVAIPSTLILDRRHRVASAFVGAVTGDELADKLRVVVDEKNTTRSAEEPVGVGG